MRDVWDRICYNMYVLFRRIGYWAWSGVSNDRLERQLIEDASEGKFIFVKLHLERKVDVDAANGLALVNAAEYGHLNVVKLLVENGADIHVQNNRPLREAATFGHFDVVKYLIEQGADVHANNDEALIMAAEEGHLNVVQILVASGADISARNYAALEVAKTFKRYSILTYIQIQYYTYNLSKTYATEDLT